jgi:hypothetical protein
MTQAALDRTSTNMLAQGLGWFSLGLGTAELFAPQAVGRFLGMRDSTTLMQSYGLREIAAGVGLLTARNAKPWMVSRVGGDVIDIATLVANFGKGNRKNANVAFALAAVLGVTVADVVCTQSLQEHEQQLLQRRKQAAFRLPKARARDARRGDRARAHPGRLPHAEGASSAECRLGCGKISVRYTLRSPGLDPGFVLMECCDTAGTNPAFVFR